MHGEIKWKDLGACGVVRDGKRSSRCRLELCTEFCHRDKSAKVAHRKLEASPSSPSGMISTRPRLTSETHIANMSQQQISAKKQQELQVQYSNYKDTLQAVAQKIGDVEQEVEEHKLVLETLMPLPGDRKCFRMINGVLVERTVKDVLPALQTNAEGLKKVLDDLVKQYQSKQAEMEKWKKKNNIQVVQQ
ncbi:hypothetical protein AC579_2708 [Pseudocercospora musae]|uniref:Prefoldin subunit 2 n=1 Tax=Pseudocercospora musae TaxID=113226 RepID=A0A139IVA9_9PEZI|nr:hypothetical protein AC579_2708 [Pseudocercospora musae]